MRDLAPRSESWRCGVRQAYCQYSTAAVDAAADHHSVRIHRGTRHTTQHETWYSAAHDFKVQSFPPSRDNAVLQVAYGLCDACDCDRATRGTKQAVKTPSPTPCSRTTHKHAYRHPRSHVRANPPRCISPTWVLFVGSCTTAGATPDLATQPLALPAVAAPTFPCR